ncbi:MAG: DUF349 domain-containing protein [Spirochaetales bacterium]|nr:DUF349 domain-containing protein [Spirochaetales bacterium]
MNNPGEQDIKKKCMHICERIEALLSQTELEKAISEFTQLNKEWDQLLPPESKRDELLLQRYTKACDSFIQQRDWALWANYKKREDICSQLSVLLKEPANQESIGQFTELKHEWQHAGIVPERKQNTLWKKYRTLCKQLYEKNREFFQEKEKTKEDNLKMKESLCLAIENLIEPDDWPRATEFVIKIQKGWDAVGPVPGEISNTIWERFQKTCRDFFERRKEYYNTIRRKQQANLEKKRELCERVESLKDSTKWKETSREIKQIQKEWQATGPVPWKKEKSLWKRFRSACDFFFNAQQVYFDELEKEKPENLKKKEELCVIVESLESIPGSEQFQTIVRVQEEWKKIGPIPKDKETELWYRFRKPIDEYFEKRNNQKEKQKKQMEQNKTLKEQLCIEAESLCNSSDWRETAARYKELQKKWKQIGLVEQVHEQALWHRFHAACDAFFERYKEYRDSHNKEKEKNLEKKLDLCFQAEIIAEVKLTKEEEEERAEWQLKKLTENFWFKILDKEADKWEDRAQKLMEMQKQWKEIGPVPSHMSEKIWKRFQGACNYFFENRGKSNQNPLK